MEKRTIALTTDMTGTEEWLQMFAAAAFGVPPDEVAVSPGAWHRTLVFVTPQMLRDHYRLDEEAPDPTEGMTDEELEALCEQITDAAPVRYAIWAEAERLIGGR